MTVITANATPAPLLSVKIFEISGLAESTLKHRTCSPHSADLSANICAIKIYVSARPPFHDSFGR